MRPSSISFASVRRAISRRIGSNDESTTACGVSSMMKSTPVRCSSERMLRPSRPMIRPFRSSDGSSTSETVVSAAWLAATRCSASATRLRARRFASARASSSSCRTRRASSWRTRSSVALEEVLLRLADGQAGDPLELGELARPRLLQLLLELPRVGLAVGHPLLAPRELLELRVDLRLAREHPLLELDDLASPLAQLLLELLPEPELPLAGLDLRLALPRLDLPVGLGEERLPTTGGGGDRGSAPRAEDEDGGDRSDDETRDQRCR